MTESTEPPEDVEDVVAEWEPDYPAIIEGLERVASALLSVDIDSHTAPARR
jgi:hypothetical protein